MKLVYVTRTSLPSKAAQSIQILSMAEAFYRHLGNDFQLISASGDATLEVSSSFLWKRVSIFRKRESLKYLFFCFLSVWKFSRDAEVVIYTRDIAIALVALLVGRTVAYEAHKLPVGRVARGIFGFAVKFENFKLVCISDALKNAYLARYPLNSKSVITAHDGVFPEHYPDIGRSEKLDFRRHLGLPLDKCVVLHTGSLYKGGSEIFERIASIDKDHSLLVHVGGNNQECQLLREYFSRKGLNNVLLIPHMSRHVVRKYQQCADVLLYVNVRQSSIFWCTSPLKLFEYMATGNPIVASSIGSVSEIVGSHNAFCFDPDEEGAVESAFLACREDASEGLKRGNRARLDALGQYTWEIRASRLIDFLSGKAGLDE